MNRRLVTYSDAFKMQVVEEIGQGRFTTISQAQNAYGICGTATIQQWIKKYGRPELMSKRVGVETMTETDELKEAKKPIRDLEKALPDSHMDYCLERAFLEIACLVERCTKFTVLKKLDRKSAFSMHKDVAESLLKFSRRKRRSVTYDDGTGNALHELTNKIIGTESYFCNPYYS